MGVAFVDQTNLRNIVERVEAGEEIVLMRNGEPFAKIEPIKPHPKNSQRRAILEAYRGAAKPFWNDDDTAERSQDFLYDEFGLPK
jgi:antitoxin (DNA-binding transcriptional repressor) of toxin-antitoxin stability system